jgi:hypothetical protein
VYSGDANTANSKAVINHVRMFIGEPSL